MKTANIATRKLKSIHNDNTLYNLLGIEEEIKPEDWVNLPAFEQRDNLPPYRVIVSFRNKEDLDKFADLLNMPSLKKEGKLSVKSIWFPPLKEGERGQSYLFAWVDENDPEFQALLNEAENTKGDEENE